MSWPDFPFWNEVRLIARALFLITCGLFVVSLFGGIAGATTGFMILLFIGTPFAGLYQHATKKCARSSLDLQAK